MIVYIKPKPQGHVMRIYYIKFAKQRNFLNIIFLYFKITYNSVQIRNHVFNI